MPTTNFPVGWHALVRANHRNTVGYVVAENGDCLDVQTFESIGPRTKVPGRRFQPIRPAQLAALALPKSWFMGIVLCPGDPVADVVTWLRARTPAERERVVLYVHPKVDEEEAGRAWKEARLPPPRTTQFQGSWAQFHQLYGLDFSWRVWSDHGSG